MTEMAWASGHRWVTHLLGIGFRKVINFVTNSSLVMLTNLPKSTKS